MDKASKRFKMSRAQQATIIEVLVASLIIGASVMLMIFLGKYINLNTKVLSAQSQSISNYQQTILNVGICTDSNNNGRLDSNELNNCNPNDVTLSDIPNTLQSNVMTNIAYNKSLESVARGSLSSTCLDSNGKTIDFLKKYQEASTESAKKEALNSVKTCSALRVIPDALPAQLNTEATLASLDWLLQQAGVRYTSLLPDTSNSSSSEQSSDDTIPISLALTTDSQGGYRALSTMERSIRAFDPSTVTIDWSKSGSLDFVIKANAYYSGKMSVQESTKKITTKTKGV